MSKIFRLYREGSNTGKGWNGNPSFPYNSNAREQIADPDGVKAKNEITSIPSPFARIDLVKTAFREVNRRASNNIKEIDGNTIYHKMVSDTLDVGEIFFNIDKLQDKVEIITCDCNAILQNLKSDDNPSHYYVADSLEKYLESDKKTYNFENLTNFYLLNYIKGPDELNIIGATSPATLFFSGANDLSYINDIFFADNDKPFDSEYQPLYKRDFEYLKAWWTIRKTNGEFSKHFPEIDKYLELTYRAISDNSKKNQLNSITVQTLDEYSEIDVKNDNQSNQVEVIGINLLKKKVGMSDSVSEFTIKPVTEESERLPLVLPVDSGNKYANLHYVNGIWGNKNKASYVEAKDLQERVLPFDGIKYPYLTVSDFLEDYIIRLPHAFNSKSYFDGNIQENKENRSYLLPIKPLFFKYFDVETLKSTMPNGRNVLDMNVVAGGSISLTLRIPIVGNGKVSYIEYQRIYYANRQPSINKTTNDGGIVEVDFTGFVMPGMKFTQETEAYYTVSCISPFSVKSKMQFFKEGQLIENVPMDCRNRQRGVFDYKAETYTLSQTNFDCIRVACGDGKEGLLVPLFPEHQGIETYEFAIDLGTSNTHIEMKKASDNQSMPFSYEESNAVMSKFCIPSYDTINGKSISMDPVLDEENDVINADFVPDIIGKDSDFSFPTHTAMSYAKCTNWEEALRVFGYLNVSMTYDKRVSYAYNAEPLVNIKWSNNTHSQTQMQLYIENLLLMIRNKVIAKNGILSKTKVVWFYPNSMSQRRLTLLRNAWNGAYKKYFSTTEDTINLSESEAPIKYYFRRYGNATNLINVDIGGGTTDVAFSVSGDVKYITSFRFAANTLFEDSFSDINPNNGIIDWFKDDIKDVLGNPDLLENTDLLNIHKSKDGHPADMASFFFSLKDNSATEKIAENKRDFDLMLQNDDKFKIVFIIFYTAIIYHIAQIVKAKEMEVPRHIAFSGNGSKIVNVLTSDTAILANYTKVIFEKILDRPYGISLEILGLDNTSNPKEATCKGGLLPINQQTSPEKVILKNASGELAESVDTYSSLDDKTQKQIVRSVEKFFNFVLREIPSAYNLDGNFGVSRQSIELAREECQKDLETYLNKGIVMSVNESGSEENTVEDTLSFYPIKGVIQALSVKIEEYLRTQR